MFATERNDLLTRVGAGTPVGGLFRRYWLPALLAQELDRPVVTGANALLAIFSETQSPAARLLGEQGISRERVATLSLTLFT